MVNILLSGGSSGIGLVFLKNFLNEFKNPNIYLITREKKNFYLDLGLVPLQLEKIIFINTDISSFSGLEKALSFIKNTKFDIAINNAGAILETSSLKKKINPMFILNSIAPFLISKIILKKNKNVKIVNISSFLHKTIKKKDLKYFSFKNNKLSNYKVYSLSKFILNLLSYHNLFFKKKSNILCVNPGIIKSHFGLKNNCYKRKLISYIRNLFGKNPQTFVFKIITYLKNGDSKDLDLSISNLIKEKKFFSLIIKELKKNIDFLNLIKKNEIKF